MESILNKKPEQRVENGNSSLLSSGWTIPLYVNLHLNHIVLSLLHASLQHTLPCGGENIFLVLCLNLSCSFKVRVSVLLYRLLIIVSVIPADSGQK